MAIRVNLMIAILPLFASQALCGVFIGDDAERVEGKIFGATSGNYTASFSINVIREHLMESRAERENRASYVEGDMKLTDLLRDVRMGDVKARAKFLQNNIWPSNVIPYVFDPTITQQKKGAIEAALKDFEKYTIIRFVPKTIQQDYINFVRNKDGCWSYVGRQGGRQDLSIGAWCGYRGTVIHEIMHALGFFHEHTRNDRNQFIHILPSGIEEDMRHNFATYDSSFVAPHIPYDYFSIMQLDSNAYGRHDKYSPKTIEAKDDQIDDGDLGQRNGFSENDIERIKAVYGKYIKGKITTLSGGLAVGGSIQSNSDKPAEINTNQTVNGQPITETNGDLGNNTIKGTNNSLVKPKEKPIEKSLTEKLYDLIFGSKQKDKIQEKTANQRKAMFNLRSSCVRSYYPCWPKDFTWSFSGLPAKCSCGEAQSCHCKCSNIRPTSSTNARDAVWKDNVLCYGDTFYNPHFELTSENLGERAEGSTLFHIDVNNPLVAQDTQVKKCLQMPLATQSWGNTFLCYDSNAPYQFYWSNNNKQSSCLKVFDPQDPIWGTKYLCDSKRPDLAEFIMSYFTAHVQNCALV